MKVQCRLAISVEVTGDVEELNEYEFQRQAGIAVADALRSYRGDVELEIGLDGSVSTVYEVPA